MAKTVYSVIVNMPGYLPQDDEPYATTNKKAALAAMAAEARTFREDADRDWKVSGNAKDGYWVSTPDSAEEYVISLHSMSAEEWAALGNEIPD